MTSQGHTRYGIIVLDLSLNSRITLYVERKNTYLTNDIIS
jgi:hypothetical protein